MLLKRKARTIPFGYKLADDTNYIEPVQEELDALKEAKELIMNNNNNTQILKNYAKEKLLAGESTIIESDNSIILPCIIGKNCKIGKDVTIGPNASIGDNTIITSDVEIKNSIIMSDCKIDGGLKINNSIISANCQLNGNNKDNSEKLFLLGEGTKISL